ncbi:MAG: hypothetical protein MI924_39045 [Chloroflexales bacterium]|nr:hypothetical protein [Chloroflexales bacterium]
MQSSDPIAVVQIGLAVLIALLCGGLLYAVHCSANGRRRQRDFPAADAAGARRRVAWRATLTLAVSVLAALLLCLLILGADCIGLKPCRAGLALLPQMLEATHQMILWELRVLWTLVAPVAGAMFGSAEVALQLLALLTGLLAGLIIAIVWSALVSRAVGTVDPSISRATAGSWSVG